VAVARLHSLPPDSAFPASSVFPLGSTAAAPSTSGTTQQRGQQSWSHWELWDRLLQMFVEEPAKAES